MRRRLAALFEIALKDTIKSVVKTKIDIAMTVKKPRYSKKEFARLGDEIYEQQILPQIKESDRRWFSKN